MFMAGALADRMNDGLYAKAATMYRLIASELDFLFRRVRLCYFTLMTGLAVVSCTRDSPPIPEAQYRAKIVGDWMGIVGDMKETISFHADGKFVSQVRPMGFISNTLGQGVTGTIRGTWVIKANIVTLNISSAGNEGLLNKSTSSTIVTLEQNELVVRSDRGDTSTFARAL